MEHDFGERLREYRKEKSLTQQELADRLQVSNKTISRWESGGGYPDVPLLIPLARILGVTVDDLLDGERPVQTLTRSDWQNLLSFAFALGGGVGFFLLRLFVPVPVCYLGYLGCMAYGVYLQRYYCYQSRWFRWGNLAMNFFVNLNLSITLAVGGLSLGTLTAAPDLTMVSLFQLGARYILLGGAFAALILTGITGLVVERGLGGSVRLALLRPTLRGSVPSIGAILLLGFWALYFSDTLPRELYLLQSQAYWGLLAMLAVLGVGLFYKNGHRWGLLSTALLCVGGRFLSLLTKEYALLRSSLPVVEVTEALSDLYPRFLRLTAAGAAAGVFLFLFCLALALIRIDTEGAGK